jgi:hypothetical protein
LLSSPLKTARLLRIHDEQGCRILFTGENLKISLIIVLSLLLPFSIVASQFLDLSTSEPVTFDKVDRNQDGLLTRQEAVNDRSLSVTFDTADANGDGSLDPHEYLQARRLVSSGNNNTLGIWY